MTLRLRLILCGVVVLLSAIYAALVSLDRGLAGVVALGYIAIILTIFVLINAWRRK